MPKNISPTGRQVFTGFVVGVLVAIFAAPFFVNGGQDRFNAALGSAVCPAQYPLCGTQSDNVCTGNQVAQWEPAPGGSNAPTLCDYNNLPVGLCYTCVNASSAGGAGGSGGGGGSGGSGGSNSSGANPCAAAAALSTFSGTIGSGNPPSTLNGSTASPYFTIYDKTVGAPSSTLNQQNTTALCDAGDSAVSGVGVIATCGGAGAQCGKAMLEFNGYVINGGQEGWVSYWSYPGDQFYDTVQTTVSCMKKTAQFNQDFKIYHVVTGGSDVYSLNQNNSTAFCNAGDIAIAGAGNPAYCDNTNPACNKPQTLVSSGKITQGGKEGWSVVYDLDGNGISDTQRSEVTCMGLKDPAAAAACATCSPICGDGLLVGTEDCDDGNKNNGDGCSSACIKEKASSSSAKPFTIQTCSQPAPAIASLAGLVSINIHEITRSDGVPAANNIITFSPNDSRLTSDVPSGTTGADFVSDALEYYDMFFSDEKGNVSANGGYLTIDAFHDTTVTSATAGMGNNIDAITLKFADGRTVAADLVANVQLGGGLNNNQQSNWGSTSQALGLPDGSSTMVGNQNSRFVVGFCSVAACGNGIRDNGEQCDDGNKKDGDGCSSACLFEQCTLTAPPPPACTTTAVAPPVPAVSINQSCGAVVGGTPNTTNYSCQVYQQNFSATGRVRGTYTFDTAEKIGMKAASPYCGTVQLTVTVQGANPPLAPAIISMTSTDLLQSPGKLIFDADFPGTTNSVTIQAVGISCGNTNLPTNWKGQLSFETIQCSSSSGAGGGTSGGGAGAGGTGNQCAQNDYALTGANTGNYYTASAQTPFTGTVDCGASPPGAGWTSAGSKCLVANSGGTCVSELCLWQKPGTTPNDYLITHGGGSVNTDNVNCSTGGTINTPSPPAGYTLASRVCAVPNMSGGCTSDVCLWKKTDTVPHTLSLSTVYTPAVGTAVASCAGQLPAGSSLLRTCMLTGISPVNHCYADLCLFKTAGNCGGGVAAGGGGSTTSQCGQQWEYMVTSANTGNYQTTLGQAIYNGPAVACTTVPSAGYVLDSSLCSLRDPLGKCVAMSCLWKKPSSIAYEFLGMHFGAPTSTDNVNCATGTTNGIPTVPNPAGYTLQSRMCLVPNISNGCASDYCLWKKVSSTPRTLTMATNVTPVIGTAVANCSPAGGANVLNIGSCMLESINPINHCYSDLCVFSRPATCP